MFWNKAGKQSTKTRLQSTEIFLRNVSAVLQ